MSLEKQIRNGESKTLELKEVLPKNDSIAKTVIAFSNTSGGKLIIGVNDRREIVGIEELIIFELQDKITSVIVDSCSPGIRFEVKPVRLENKLILLVDIPGGDLKPYFLRKQGKVNGTYIRLGATNRSADFETISELERQKRHLGFDEETVYDTDFSKLDLKPLFHRFEQAGKPLNEDKLANLKLIKSENGQLYPVNALLILLGKLPHCTVKCARFKGTSMEVFIDKKEYGGDIFSVLENVQNFVLNHINLKAEIEGLYRKETYEIPVVALREALINALIHRDYTKGGRDIKVGVYDDAVNIVSPGRLPGNMTIEDVFSGRSEVRNLLTARVFKELGLVEQWGSGINRIINACKENGLQKPKIVEQNDFVDIEIYRQNVDLQTVTNIYDRLRPITADYDQLSTEEKRLLLYLLDREKISRKEAVELLNLGDTKVKELFNLLLEKKLVERKGQGRGTFYKLKS